MEIPHEIRANHVPKKGAIGCPRRETKFNPERDSDMSMFFLCLEDPSMTVSLILLKLEKTYP